MSPEEISLAKKHRDERERIKKERDNTWLVEFGRRQQQPNGKV